MCIHYKSSLIRFMVFERQHMVSNTFGHLQIFLTLPTDTTSNNIWRVSKHSTRGGRFRSPTYLKPVGEFWMAGLWGRKAQWVLVLYKFPICTYCMCSITKRSIKGDTYYDLFPSPTSLQHNRYIFGTIMRARGFTSATNGGLYSTYTTHPSLKNPPLISTYKYSKRISYINLNVLTYQPTGQTRPVHLYVSILIL